MRECGADLVIIDSLTVASSGIDPKEARDIIGLLKGLEKFGTVLAVDHIRTPEPGADTSDYRPFGSAFKHHLARSLLMVTRAASGVIAIRNTKANFDEKSAPLYLALIMDDQNRIAKVEWLEPGDERLDAMTGIPADERIVQALARSEGEISTVARIAQELGLAPKTISNRLTVLRTKGRVESLGDGRWRFLPDSLSKGTGSGK
jgi:DNA-binding transcriptional ArsR family regulator